MQVIDIAGAAAIAHEHDSLLARLRDVMVQTVVLRGLKTLGIRVERAQRNAMVIARWLGVPAGGRRGRRLVMSE